MILLLLLLLLQYWSAVVSAQGWPGPRTVSAPTTPGGPQTWSALQSGLGKKVYNYNVRDFGATSRPKLVYNCKLVPALCKTSEKYMGVGMMQGQFHYDAFRYKDPNKATRVDARRDKACPGNWLNGHTCPEADQPDWTWKAGGVINPKVKAELYTYRDGTTHRNRLAKVEKVWELDGDDEQAPLKEVYESTPYGAVVSCDEFPAASWIEGGEGASTYCAPWASVCNEVDVVGPNPDNVVAATDTEQNWQGKGHDALRQWFQHMSPGKWAPFTGKQNYTIFKFDFERSTTVPDNVGDAVWVEVRGVKRYCFGPAPTGRDNCYPDHDADDDAATLNAAFP